MRRIFTSFFPLTCVATTVNKFLKMKQDKPLEYWIPEYDLAARKSGIALDYGSHTNVEQRMKLINATCPGFDKVVLRKHPGLTSMQECAKDLEAENVGKVTSTLQALVDALRAYEKKLQGKVDRINENRSSSKMIRFYGASVDSADIPAEVSFVQETQVTKSDLKQLKEEIRNKTQALVQDMVQTVRADINNDMKSMLTSFEKTLSQKIDANQKEQNTTSFDKPRDSGYGRPRERQMDTGFDRGYERGMRNSRYGAGNRGGRDQRNSQRNFAMERSGGNREYPPGSGTRACFICDSPTHPFARCDKLDDPAYAEKKAAAFARTRRGIYHLERSHESAETDDLRDAFDPRDRLEDEAILHIALDTMEQLEDEDAGAHTAAAHSATMTAALQSGYSGRSGDPRQTGAECNCECSEQVTAPASGDSEGRVTATETATETATDSAALRHGVFCGECMDRLDNNEPSHMPPTELTQGHTEAAQGVVPDRVGVSCGGAEAEGSNTADTRVTRPTEPV